MSGLRRRVARNASRESRSSGFKAGRQLEAVMPTLGNESFPAKVRRYVRQTYQANDIRRSIAGHRPPPAGLTDRAPLQPKG